MAVQGLAAALAAASAYLRAQLPPEGMRLVSAGYSALPAGTSTAFIVSRSVRSTKVEM